MDIIAKKIAAIAIVLVMLTGAVAVLSSSDTVSSDKEINLISRVNEEGSSIFLDEKYDPADFCTVTDGVITVSDEQKANWGGKIFGTPGVTSIQHKMLEQFVKETVEKKFMPYKDGDTKSDDTVYYNATLTNLNVWRSSQFMDGGTVWEPVCTAIILDTDRGARELLNSATLEPNHTCCVIGASHAYLSTHEEAVVRFLAAFVESTDVMNDALGKGAGNIDYENLVEMAMKSTNQSRNVVTTAMADVKYTYGNDGFGDNDATPLVSLRNSIATFAKNAGFSTTMSDIGYTGTNGYVDFANSFVDDTYLSQAINFVYDPDKKYDYTRISVAVISGDVHQIALHYGVNEGIFDKYGIAITTFPAANGQGVATSLQNGAASIGLMGAPPITSTVINSKLDTARDVTVSGTVVDASDAPVNGAKVTITSASGEKFTGTTDKNGSFSIKVLSGTYSNSETGPDSGILIEKDSLSYSNSLERVGSDTKLGELEVS